MVRGGRIVAQRVLRGRRLFPMDHDPLVADLSITGSRGLVHVVVRRP